ncbi:MAG: hypothetical protein E7773_14650, partial [Sphingomonas sp.]
DGATALVAAVQWLQGALLGTVATTVAVIAVAAVGFLMLGGRMDWRRGVTVIVGCFVLFGATSIVAGVRGTTGDAIAAPAVPPYSAPPPVVRPSPVPTAAYDPYAGASAQPN